MTWIITRLCRDCVNTDCVTVCPVDCIYRYTGDDHGSFPNQLYINPEECIDCSACEPACPWEAIFEEDAVPGLFHDDTALNYKIIDDKGAFEVCPHEDRPKPTSDELEKNKEKWGYRT